MSKQVSQDRQIIDGVTFPAKWPEYICQLWLFQFAPKLETSPFWRPDIEGRPETYTLDGNPAPRPYTGGGRYAHTRRLSEICFPQSFQWNPWAEKAVQAFCENEQTAIVGCAGSGKSTDAGLYALFWYLCAPNDSAVLIASTTLESAKKRIWKEIMRFYRELSRKLGGSVGTTVPIGNPRPCIRAAKDDSAHGMYVVAVAKGEVDKGVEYLKGFHPKRLLMIGDELDSISQAVVEVGPNQRVGTLAYQTIWLGNKPSLLNPLGELMHVEKTKEITADMKEWTSAKGIKCLRFDGLESPALKPGSKWTGLIRQEDIDAITKQYGENSPGAWVMIRGLNPPEGAANTVLSEAAISRFHCREKVIWERDFILSGMLDPAFGGDKCIFRTMKRGKDKTGQMRVELDELIEIPIVADSPENPADFQISDKVRELCKARSIIPSEFITDSTGIGRGVASNLQRDWSPSVQVCDFGGGCSDMIVSEENPKPAKELYDRRCTELWFSIREFVYADMIRGLDNTTAQQLCSREHTIKGTGDGKRITIQKKEEMTHSPDEADALAAGIELLRRKGINASIQTPAKAASNTALESQAKEYDFDSGQTYQDDIDTVTAGYESEW